MIINLWIITQVHILDRRRSLQEIGRRKIEEEQTGTEPNLYIRDTQQSIVVSLCI